MTLSEAAARVNIATIGVIKRRDTNRIAKKHRPKVSAFFRSQKQLVLEAMEKQKYLFSESFGKLSEGPVDFTQQNFDRLWDDIEIETETQLQQIITRIEAEAITKGASAANNLFVSGKGGSFDLANPRAVNWFMEKGGNIKYIKDIQATTRNQLQTVITNAIDGGWSYQQTAKEISQKFDVFSRARAQRIAVFESGQAYEAGNRMLIDTVADQGIVMQEQWKTSNDDKVRPEHTANEAEGWVELDHVFASGDISPPTDPGCRCYMVYREAPR